MSGSNQVNAAAPAVQTGNALSLRRCSEVALSRTTMAAVSEPLQRVARLGIELRNLDFGQQLPVAGDDRVIKRLERLSLPRHGLGGLELLARVAGVVLEHLLAERLAEEVADRSQGHHGVRDEILKPHRVQRRHHACGDRRLGGKDGGSPLAGDLAHRLRIIRAVFRREPTRRHLAVGARHIATITDDVDEDAPREQAREIGHSVDVEVVLVADSSCEGCAHRREVPVDTLDKRAVVARPPAANPLPQGVAVETPGVKLPRRKQVVEELFETTIAHIPRRPIPVAVAKPQREPALRRHREPGVAGQHQPKQRGAGSGIAEDEDGRRRRVGHVSAPTEGRRVSATARRPMSTRPRSRRRLAAIARAIPAGGSGRIGTDPITAHAESGAPVWRWMPAPSLEQLVRLAAARLRDSCAVQLRRSLSTRCDLAEDTLMPASAEHVPLKSESHGCGQTSTQETLAVYPEEPEAQPRAWRAPTRSPA